MISIIFNGKLEPKGGPSGYLFNLKESLELNNIKNIKIISNEEINKNKNYKYNHFKKYFLKIFPFIKKLILLIIPNFFIEKIKFFLFRKFLIRNKDLINSSQIIHFHTTKDMYYFSKIFNLRDFIVVLTSHSPEPTYMEIFDVFKSRGYSSKYCIRQQNIQRAIDIFSFRNSNYLVYPCQGAVNPYKSFFEEFNIEYKNKLKYVLTASKPLIPKVTIDEYKKKYSIPMNKKIVCYVGRKNSIKGFDIFCNIAIKMLNNDDYFFVSAGIGEISAPFQKNFFDIGWTDDPASLINISDVVIVPNRDTYFDLGIIQTLSLNKPIITTDTGGNSWFKDKDINLFFASSTDINDFIRILESNILFIENKKNYEIYNNYFMNNDFALNYLNLYSDIKL